MIATKGGKKSSTTDLPSKNEQLSLQNTEILVKSNLMRMQLDELLASVRGSQSSSKRAKIDSWLDNICSLLKACESKLTGTEITAKWLSERKLRGFTLDGQTSGTSSIVFEKPESVEVIGSHALNSGTAPFLNCDLAMVMPKDAFDSRDVLNYAYFNKRKLYLAAISEVLSDGGLCKSIEVSYFQSDHRKPYLILKPNFTAKYSVNLYPCAPTAVFKLVQLLSSKNNVRPEWWMQELQVRKPQSATSMKKVKGDANSGEKVLDVSLLSATPHYNMAILEDLAMIPQYRMLMKASGSCPCFRDVCILLKIWLAQKNLRFGTSGLGGHNIKIIVAYLFQSRRIGQQTTVLGAFQMVLSFLTDTNFSSIDLYFSGSNKQHSQEKWPAKLYHPVGKDVDGVQFNSLWRVSFSALQDLQNEAKIALGLLQLESDAVFHRIFLEDRNCLSRYDLIFHVPLNALSSSSSSQLSNSNLLTESDGTNPETEMEDMTIAHFACSKALTIAKRALSNRVKLVSASLRDRDAACSVDLGLSSTVTSWDRHAQPINTLKSLVITIGIVLDTENAHRRVDKCARHSDEDGLAVEEAAAAEEFRNFWGRKSELRRFKDGAIVDAVVWGEQDIHANSDIVKAASDIQSATLREVTGESIVEAIIRYSLGMHMSSCAGPKGELLDCLGGSLEFALPGSNYVKDELSNGVNTTIQKILDSTPKQRYLQVVEALDKLRSILTSDIKDLPLVFESIAGSHPALRYTSTLPPMPHPMLLKDTLKDYSGVTLSLVAQPLEIIGQVEGGGKWPSESKVARKLKTAVLLRTSHLLRTQFEISSQASHEHLDIYFRGFIFRLVVFSTSEDTSCSVMRTIRNSSMHHQSIRALHTQHSDSFSTAVRLMSVWMSKQCFSGFLSQRQLELLVAAVYMDPTSLSAPTTAASALYRILDLLGKHDFDMLPLGVNFAADGVKGSFSRQTANAFQAFKASPLSQTFSLLVLSSDDFVHDDAEFVIGNADSMLERALLSLVQSAARAAAKRLISIVLIEEQSLGNDMFECSNIMREQCNIVLTFNSSMHCKGSRGHLTGPKFATLKVYANMTKASCSSTRLVISDSNVSSANTVQEEIVMRLRKQFKDVAFFFWDETAGDRLGVLLKPSTFITSAFSSTNSRRKISISTGSASHSHMLTDVSQIAMNIYAGGCGCFSDITFR